MCFHLIMDVKIAVMKQSSTAIVFIRAMLSPSLVFIESPSFVLNAPPIIKLTPFYPVF
ncbi:MAG: hypothetical protein PWR10_2476 [Halanaerobiales bacterium]|nr:hypothetical protein [Halanaerobiales bacterium]